MTNTPPSTLASIEPITIKPEMRIRTLSDDDLAQIHQATLTVISECGVQFPCESALKVFAEAGAAVDTNKRTVKIPPDLLMSALARAPRRYTMASRGSRRLDMVLDGTKTYGTTDGTGTTTVDLVTGQRRASIKKDVAMMAKITDSLPSVSCYWPVVSAQDVPEPVISLHEIEASVTNTEKHVHIISCTKPDPARYAVEIARVVSGDADTMKTRPPLSMLACPISPLSQDGEALQAALEFAKAGLPVGFATMPMLGSTAPAAIAGLLVTGNVELLSAICYVQLVCPGAPVYYAFFSTMMNPYTGGCVSSTQHQHLLNAGVIELGHYYNLPVMAGYGAGDSTKLDSFRTGRDLSIDTLFIYLHQPDMVAGMGLLENDTLLNFEQILLDDDIYRSLQTMTRGIRVTSENLAVDDILAAGPGGHFLESDFTRRNLRELWTPGVLRNWSPEENDFLNPRKAALDRVREILTSHEPAPLEDHKAAEIRTIIKSAENALL